MYHVFLQVNCAKLYYDGLSDGCFVHNYVKGIKSTRLNFLVIIVMQVPYFSDPSHDTEAYRELVAHWGDGLCHPHKKRHDFFCHEKGNLLGYPIKTTLGFPETFVLIIFFYYCPPIIYMTVVSIRFYGAKNWLNGVLGNPAYFVLPVTTCLSFYEKTNSYQIGPEENGKKEEPTDQSQCPDHRESSQEDQNVHSPEAEARFQFKEMGVEQEGEETQSNANSNQDQNSTEGQVSIIQENDSECCVVTMCEVRGEQVQNKVMKQTVSESNPISFDEKEENKTNVPTSMEMTFSVSQSNVLYGYYMCLTTLLLSVSFLNSDRKFSSFLSLRQIFLIDKPDFYV